MLPDVTPAVTPELDPGFCPAVLWNRAYAAAAAADADAEELVLTVTRSDGTTSRRETRILPHTPANRAGNERYVERLVKCMLWVYGGYRITVGGNPELAAAIGQAYSDGGSRAFDCDIMGTKIYGRPLTVESCEPGQAPAAEETEAGLGRNLDGCRTDDPGE